MNILVPSAGKRYLHIKYLRESVGVEKIVTTELSPLAPGIHAADRAYQVPRITSPDYLDTIWEICCKESIDLIVPLMDNDIVVFSRNRARFEQAGIRFLLAPEETIEVTMDKLATFQFLQSHGLPAPLTICAADWQTRQEELRFPLLIKPRFPATRAAKGYDISVMNNWQEFHPVLNAIAGMEENYVFQEYLQGTELTIDFFCDREGKLISAVPGERLGALTRAFSRDGGAISMGKIIHDERIVEMVRTTTQHMRFYGPANFQGYRISTPEGEKIKFTEINPRFTGATVMTRAAGRDFFQWSVDLASGKDIPTPQEDYRDVYMSSWLSPIFFEEPPVLSVQA